MLPARVATPWHTPSFAGVLAARSGLLGGRPWLARQCTCFQNKVLANARQLLASPYLQEVRRIQIRISTHPNQHFSRVAREASRRRRLL
jgi:hypothetical protein